MICVVFRSTDVSERPASIFQCRMKLFSEWFFQWSDEEKQELLIRLRNIDSKFMDEFQSNIESNNTTTGATTDDYQSTGSHVMNGNIDDDSKSSEQLVINGLNSDQIQELDLKVSVVEEEEEVEVSPQETEQPLVEQTNDSVVEAQEVDVVIVGVVSGGDEEEEVECLKKGTDESVVNSNETSSEVIQEVCG